MSIVAVVVTRRKESFHVKPTFSAADFQARTGVSRETLDRFRIYAELLQKWQTRINLVGPTTVTDLWQRHFLDSAQLYSLIPEQTQTLVDLGSGAGFPGLVLAMMGVRGVNLIESDQRKAAFLAEASRVAQTPVKIHACRIELAPALKADVVTSRALAALPQLLEMASPFVGPETLCLFPKGQNVEGELTEAHKIWSIQVNRYPSVTDPHATILALREVLRDRTS